MILDNSERYITFNLRLKVLSFGKLQKYLHFRLLNRTFDLCRRYFVMAIKYKILFLFVFLTT